LTTRKPSIETIDCEKIARRRNKKTKIARKMLENKNFARKQKLLEQRG